MLAKRSVEAVAYFLALIDYKLCVVTAREQFSRSGRTAARQKGKTKLVDQQTKQALKHDQFVDTTNHGLEWASENRRSVILTSAIVLAAILVVVGSVLIYNSRASQASVAFGAAMQAYQTPLAAPGQPVPPGVKTYASVAERAKAANDLFTGVADKYGMTPDGRVARYFAGLTYMEQGQNAPAESTLKQVAGGWNGDLAALANLSLAQLYRQTGRDSQAIDLYNQLTAKPTSTVPSGLAQLQLAELYETEGKPDLAKKIYAQLKDKDAKGPAGVLAAQKLNPAPAGPAGQ
jgi:tetratricopeptide (TPR) repeat protein